ncbi:MAG: hypothetical protein ACLR2O_15940 [Coprococcus sp.]
MQKQLDGMDSDVYQEYVKIPEEDRNEEQQAYVNKWENLNAQLAGIQAQKTQLETAKSGLLAQAGFATEADLDAQITSLTTQRDELDKKEAALLGQEQTLAAQEERAVQCRQTDYRRRRARSRQPETQLDGTKITDYQMWKAQIQSAWALLNEKEALLNASKHSFASGEQELADWPE